MAQDVTGLGGYQALGLDDIALGRVLLLDALKFLRRALAEHVLEEFVHVAAIGHGTLGGTALVQDGHRGPVLLRLLQAVLVDELAEDFVGALLLRP